jgi:exodeoxyribonuclease VII small subunit
MPKKSKAIDFESAIQELETIVEQMEQGELSLEESLKQFERGIELTRNCQKSLQQAEQKVQILLQKNGQATLEEFDSDSE